MNDLQDLREILEILNKQDEMLKMLEDQQDEIEMLQRKLSQTEEQLDESLAINSDLEEENRQLAALFKNSETQRKKLLIQIEKLKSLQE